MGSKELLQLQQLVAPGHKIYAAGGAGNPSGAANRGRAPHATQHTRLLPRFTLLEITFTFTALRPSRACTLL